jgi:hypothetical protein
MVAQDIVNAVSTDTRQVLGSSGNDANVILNWIDRVQKDVLHTTLYINLNMATTSISTAIGVNSYSLSPPTPIRRVVSIYDQTFNMSLKPADADIDQPSPTQSNVDESQGRAISTSVPVSPHQAYKFGGTPEYFRFVAPTTLLIRPAPPLPGFLSTLSVTYEQLITTITNLNTELIVPDDGKDVMCAGVNWLAMAYIGRAQEAMSWFQLYQQLKAGNRVGVMR